MSSNIKNAISRSLVFIIKLLNKLDNKLTNYSFNPNPNDFDDLTPKILENENDTYLNTLKWALRNENVKNIALTGPYGSGKSTIIKTFQHFHKDYNYLNVSLASFKEQNSKPNAHILPLEGNLFKQTTAYDEENKLIELSILQQIFYKEKAKKMRDSRFKRIKRIYWINLTIKSIIIFLWLFSCLYILNPDFLEAHNWWKQAISKNESLITIICFSIIVIGSIYVLYFIIRFLLQANFNKLNVFKGEFELSPEGSSSVLNKYLDEIIYFFEITNHDIVVIEDLDRFDNYKSEEIFTKLRELNTIINNSLQIKRKVVFIYALKDDIFKSRGRTKFFDFIIPVIPIINSFNSYERLIQKFEKNSNDIKLNKDFIRDISLYIDDMRILINIFNEFILYKEKLSDLKLIHNKLLAMITYKNIYPDDFEDLHNKQGMVYTTFRKKDEVLNELASEIDNEIEDLELQIKGVNDSYLNSLEELRSVYIYKLIETYGCIRTIRVNNTS